MAELQRGVVKWFNDAKGFGFIEHTTGKDVFVHYSVIESEGFKTLKDGEEVDYQLNEGDKGLHALRVIRLAAPAEAPSDASKAGEMLAPNLESGSVQSTVRTASSMIEVEKDEAEDSIGGVDSGIPSEKPSSVVGQ